MSNCGTSPTICSIGIGAPTPDWLLFCEMVGAAAHWVEHRGWKAVLGGPSPFDPNWLALMGERGLLATVSAVGFHGFPGTWDSETDTWRGYAEHLRDMRAVLDRFNRRARDLDHRGGLLDLARR